MSFKISNTNIEENEKIIDANTKLGQLFSGFMMLQGAIEELQGGGAGGVRNVFDIDGGGGVSVYTLSNGTVAYSLNQSPAQMLIDANGDFSPAIGSEYIIYTGPNNAVYIETQKTDGRIQISGTATNTANASINMGINCKCTVTKITATLWVVQGDGLTYIS
jgi:hypothetical protein